MTSILAFEVCSSCTVKQLKNVNIVQQLCKIPLVGVWEFEQKASNNHCQQSIDYSVYSLTM